ncbi:hypothetical protein C3L33_17359, partial [Rhododendron williamsianum]
MIGGSKCRDPTCSGGDRMMDYMTLDDRSIGMFWVVSYTMAQPACETVMTWLTSAGLTELLPGSNLQSNDRLMVMREVCPLPVSLLSGFSINLLMKLAFQMEDSMFSGQGNDTWKVSGALTVSELKVMVGVFFAIVVVPSIAMIETYVRMLLLAPHALFRSHLSISIARVGLFWLLSFSLESSSNTFLVAIGHFGVILLCHFTLLYLAHLSQRNPALLNRPGASLLVLEILNYRLLSLYRYQGKSKNLMYDITKIISTLKGKRGDHRILRLAENLCMNLIFSLREFFFAKKEGKGPTEFTETLNRITITTLAIIIKTRGIAEAEQLLYLPTMVEQILATSQHTWSEKTLRYFPPILRDALSGRIDKRGLAIQTWQQVTKMLYYAGSNVIDQSFDPVLSIPIGVNIVQRILSFTDVAKGSTSRLGYFDRGAGAGSACMLAETTVIHQCTQLLSPSADPSYVVTYISHSFPQHRKYLCAGAWILMHGHPENINNANLGRVLREFSPEEVTDNIYTMVDVLLHHIQLELQHGHSLQELISKASTNLAYFIWTNELLPLDILLLALIDRDDDPHALRIAISAEELDIRNFSGVLSEGMPICVWLRVMGIPLHLLKEVFNAIGDKCGGFLDVDKDEVKEHLKWVHIKVRVEICIAYLVRGGSKGGNEQEEGGKLRTWELGKASSLKVVLPLLIGLRRDIGSGTQVYGQQPGATDEVRDKRAQYFEAIFLGGADDVVI